MPFWLSALHFSSDYFADHFPVSHDYFSCNRIIPTLHHHPLKLKLNLLDKKMIALQWRIQDFMLGGAKNESEKKKKKIVGIKNLGKIGFFPVISSKY